MRLSATTTEVYGYTTSMLMILVSCHYVLSETHNSIPIMHWRWTIKCSSFHLWINETTFVEVPWNLREILMKMSITTNFIPIRSSFYFFIGISNYLLSTSRWICSQPTCLIGRISLTSTLFYFGLMSITKTWIEAKATINSLMYKRFLSMLLNKYLIVIQQESTQALWSLSWLWRKRFVPGIHWFMS